MFSNRYPPSPTEGNDTPQPTCGMLASHCCSTVSMPLRDSISCGTRSFVSSKLGKQTSSNESSSMRVEAFFRNTQGLENVEASVLSNNSKNWCNYEVGIYSRAL